MRYEFKYFETDIAGKETGNQSLTSFHADSLDQMLERFEYFLKGCGFHFDGKVDIVTEDNADLDTFKINLDNDNEFIFGGGGPDPAHSPFYYEPDRNKPLAGSNDWDHYSDLPSPDAYVAAGGAHSTFNIDSDGDFEIKFDTSNIYIDINNTMAGYPHER